MAGATESGFPNGKPLGKPLLPKQKRSFVQAFLESLDDVSDARTNFTADDVLPLNPSISMSTITASRNDDTPRKRIRMGTKTIRGDDSSYIGELENRRVAPEESSVAPSNIDELLEYLQRPRAVPDEKQLAAELYEVAIDATVEGNIKSIILPEVLSARSLIAAKTSKVSFNAPWASSLPDHQNTRISPPKPDVCIGLCTRDFRQYSHAMACIEPSVVRPVISIQTLIFPFFSAEAKGLQSSEFARRQNLNTGSVMLQNLRHVYDVAGESEAFDNTIHILSMTVDKSSLTLRGHFTYVERNNSVWYHSIKLGAFFLGDPVSIQKGIQQIRNAVDWATEHTRDSLQRILESLNKRPVTESTNTA